MLLVNKKLTLVKLPPSFCTGAQEKNYTQASLGEKEKNAYGNTSRGLECISKEARRLDIGVGGTDLSLHCAPES